VDGAKTKKTYQINVVAIVHGPGGGSPAHLARHTGERTTEW
jgi:hypothetical protein